MKTSPLGFGQPCCSVFILNTFTEKALGLSFWDIFFSGIPLHFQVSGPASPLLLASQMDSCPSVPCKGTDFRLWLGNQILISKYLQMVGTQPPVYYIILKSLITLDTMSMLCKQLLYWIVLCCYGYEAPHPQRLMLRTWSPIDAATLGDIKTFKGLGQLKEGH